MSPTAEALHMQQAIIQRRAMTDADRASEVAQIVAEREANHRAIAVAGSEVNHQDRAHGRNKPIPGIAHHVLRDAHK